MKNILKILFYRHYKSLINFEILSATLNQFMNWNSDIAVPELESLWQQGYIPFTGKKKSINLKDVD